MGYERHHAIVVTAYRDDYINAALEKAAQIFSVRQLSSVTPAMNGFYSFTVHTDGSKEGWPDSDAGDERRANFKEWLRGQGFDDGSTPYRWVEVQYGDDNWETKVVDDSHADRRAKSR